MLSLYWFSLQKYFCIDNANLIKNFKSTKNFYSKALSIASKALSIASTGVSAAGASP